MAKEESYRSKLIKIFTFLGGTYFFLEFVLPPKIAGVQIDQYHQDISTGFTLIGAMAIGLGIINLLYVHGSKIAFRKKGWGNSFFLLVGLGLMTVITGGDWLATKNIADQSDRFLHLRDFARVIVEDAAAERKKQGVLPAGERNSLLIKAVSNLTAKLESEELADSKEGRALNQSLSELKLGLTKLCISSECSEEQLSANSSVATSLSSISVLRRDLLTVKYEKSETSELYSFLYEGLFVALGSAMFSLLGFYIASAAFRAFRIQSLESSLMMIAAILVMLGQIPFGLWLWSDFPELRLWILRQPNTAAFRAIHIGASVGALVMAFRMWLSIESESFSED